MNDPLYFTLDQVPKLLEGARIYIAPHQGGSKGMPSQLKLWLKALGAVLVKDVAPERGQPATHVLHQNERLGYDVFHTSLRCQQQLYNAHGKALSIVDRPRLAPPRNGRLEVVLCNSDTFLGVCQTAVRSRMRQEAGARRRDTLFEALGNAPTPFVGI